MCRHSFALRMLVSSNLVLDRRLGLSPQERREYEALYGNVWLLVRDLLGHKSETVTREIYLEPVRGRLVALVRRRGGDVQRGRPWRLPLEDRVLLVATYWRTKLTLRQVAPLFGVSKSAADRILDHLAPLLAISPARRPRKDTVYIVDGTLVPTRDRSVAASSKNYRYSTNLQVVIDANSRLVVAIGIPLPGSRNDCRAFTESGVDRACRDAPTIADGGYQGTGLLIPHRKRRGQMHLGPQQEAENAVHRQARARVKHALSRLKNWKILRDCRLKGNGVHQAMLGIARLHNLALTG
jgi:hypothetical protein